MQSILPIGAIFHFSMNAHLLVTLLAFAIAFIILSTSRWKWHPFLALILAAYGVGLLGGLPFGEVLPTIVDGFGKTLGSIGIVIAAGSIIGVILEKSGGTAVIANLILSKIGRNRSALGMSLTGAVVSVPVFCDSGFIILSPLNRLLASKGKQSLATLTVALSMGLYTTHVFVPPTPGPIAAAGTLGADIGLVILLGLFVSIPVILVSYLFAGYIGKRVLIESEELEEPSEGECKTIDAPDASAMSPAAELPSSTSALLPILVPMLLIGAGSLALLPGIPLGLGTTGNVVRIICNPNTALILGIFLAFRTASRSIAKSEVYGQWVGSGLSRAGAIVLITGAGGAFGNVLRATDIADVLGSMLAHYEIGLFLPFLVAAAIKTAQGSSTVSIITTASMLVPLLESLGLSDGLGPTLATLAIGAGAMTVSHANDSYFWIVSQFSGMRVDQAYKLQTLSSAVAGLSGIVVIFLIGLFL